MRQLFAKLFSTRLHSDIFYQQDVPLVVVTVVSAVVVVVFVFVVVVVAINLVVAFALEAKIVTLERQKPKGKLSTMVKLYHYSSEKSAIAIEISRIIFKSSKLV